MWIFEIETYKLLFKIRPPRGPDTSEFSPDGKMLLVTGDKARLYDLSVNPPKQIAEMPGRAPMSFFPIFAGPTFAPDGRSLVTADNETVYRWNLTTSPPSLKKEHRLKQGSKARFAGFLAGGKHLAVVSQEDNSTDAEFQVWDVAGEEPVVTDRKPIANYSKGSIQGGISGKGNRVVLSKGRVANGFVVFDVNSGKLTEIDSFDNLPGTDLSRSPFSGDGRWLNVRTNSGFYRRDTAARKSIGAGPLPDTVLSPSGRLEAAGTSNGQSSVKVLQICDISPDGKSTPRPSLGNVQVPARVSADWRQVVTAHDDGYRVWSFNGPAPSSTLVPGQVHDGNKTVLVPSGRLVVKPEYFSWVVLDPARPQTPVKLPIWYGSVVRGSPVGATVAVSEGKDEAYRLSLWDVSVDPPQKLASSAERPQGNSRLHFSPDGSVILAISSMGTTFYMRQGERLIEKATDPGYCHFEPDGTVTRLQAGVVSRNEWTGTKLRQLTSTDIRRDKIETTSSAYADDGRTLLVSYDDGVVRILDVATGKDRSAPQQWDGKTNLVAAADQRYVFAENPNGTLYVLRLAQPPQSLATPPALSTTAKRRFASDEWIDVIPLIDPALDKYDIDNLTGKNDWRLDNGSLRYVSDDKGGKLLFPIRYIGRTLEWEVDFTRTATIGHGFTTDIPFPDGIVGIFIEQGGANGGIYVGTHGDPSSELNKTFRIGTSKRSKLRFRVTRDGLNDRVELFIDDKPAGQWTGDLAKKVRKPSGHNYDTGERNGIFVNKHDDFTFHSIRVRMLNGATAETIRPAPAAPQADFVSLFNGKDLTGWSQRGERGWSVNDGVLVGKTTGPSGWLMSDREFGDFELEFDYKLPVGGNSGIFLRAWPEGAIDGANFHEVQLLDDAAPQYANVPANRKNGSVFNQLERKPPPLAPADTWTKVNIAMLGNHVTVLMNGVRVTDGQLSADKRLTGHIGLQLYPPKGVEFRNIRVRELTPRTTPTKPITTYKDPAFQQWMKEVATLPTEKQLEAVSKKLIELNPGFDGKLESYDRKGAPKVENGVVAELSFVVDHVTDISPIRALSGLKALKCFGSDAGKGLLIDLSPLRGLPIESLSCFNTPIADLSPLNVMPLTRLYIHGTRVSDLSPLRGMKLTNLGCASTPVSDLSTLQECKSLVYVDAKATRVTAASAEALRKALPKCQLLWDDPAKPITTYKEAAFQQWMKDLAAMPAEKQIDAVSKKLQELNPGFDGALTGPNKVGTPKIENGVVTELGFANDNVIDLSPIRALLGLKVLTCYGTAKGRLSDLSPLRGLKLTYFGCSYVEVSDLSPLQGMPLIYLAFGSTKTSDLSPLKEMPLETLWCNNTPVSDLSPLQGMTTLRTVMTGGTPVSDLSPLHGCKNLVRLNCTNTKVTPASIAACQKALPNCKIEWDGKPLTNINDPAFQQWVKDVAALPAEKQLQAVSKKLMELNPDFDGKLRGLNQQDDSAPRIANGVVTELALKGNEVLDLSPARALVGLQFLRTNCGSLVSLSPLTGMSMTKLTVEGCKVSDLSPVSDLPLESLCVYGTHVSDLRPISGLKLTTLIIMNTPVTDLSPLRGMPLKSLSCLRTAVSDLSPIHECRDLTTLDVRQTKVTAAGIAALQKALPNCKIEWDDPEKKDK